MQKSTLNLKSQTQTGGWYFSSLLSIQIKCYREVVCDLCWRPDRGVFWFANIYTLGVIVRALVITWCDLGDIRLVVRVGFI